MKRINTSYVSDPSIQQPLTTKSLDFLQNANKEMISTLCRNLIANNGLAYSPTTPYYMGGVDSTTFPSDGSVFFNNELYILTTNYSSLPYAVVDASPDATSDPLLFTDGINRNVHNNRYITYTSTLAGSLFTLASIVSVIGHTPFTTIVPESTGDYTVPASVNTQANSLKMRLNAKTNEVEFRGFVQKGSDSGIGTIVIYILPIGMRPLQQVSIPVGTDAYGTTYTVLILPNGRVGCQPPDGAKLCLDNLKFSLDN